MKTLNILFLGGAKRVSVARHLKEYGQSIGYVINIFSYELGDKLPIASVGKIIVGLKWSDKNLISDLQKVIKDKNINVVLPFVDPAILVASRLKELCPDVFIPVSGKDICEIMFDKLLSARWFKNNSIPQPDFFEKVEDIHYPVILKPRTGSASKGILVCGSQEELPVKVDSYLVQHYIKNPTEISVDCYVGQNGEILSVVPRIRLETLGGEVVRSQTMRDESVIELSCKILSSGCFRGPITIQFLKDKDGNLYVMEINPRLGGGVVTSIGAGSGIISMLIKEALQYEVRPKCDWKDRTMMVRYLEEVIFYADNN